VSRPKFAARRDIAEAGVVDALKAIGCDVICIGEPVDLLVGFQARNYLIEVKTPGESYKGTKKQQDWIKGWRGQVRTVETPEEAIALVMNAYRPA